MKSLNVLFSPAEFAALSERNLDDTTCVVFDIFRATSTMITALAHGAKAVIPVSEISEALAIRRREPLTLLAGERDGLRIRAEQAGGVDFDLGNSPGEFTQARVSGRTIAMTTTNGTRALRACAHSAAVLVGSFLNLSATVDRINRTGWQQVLIVCSGTFQEAAYEDILAAGALCARLGVSGEKAVPAGVSDSALAAVQLFERAQGDLIQAASASRNGRRLLAITELAADVPFCLQQDCFDRAAALDEGGNVLLV